MHTLDLSEYRPNIEIFAMGIYFAKIGTHSQTNQSEAEHNAREIKEEVAIKKHVTNVINLKIISYFFELAIIIN